MNTANRLSYGYLDGGIQTMNQELIEKARKSIRAFTVATKPDYRMWWHHKKTCDKLNDWIEGKIKYLMIFEPPRHGKSELVSRRLPAYLHGRFPDTAIMAASYSDILARKMAVSVQQIIDSPAYKQIFPDTSIWPQGTPYAKGVRNQNEHHIIGRKGLYMGQGVGGSYTGQGANFILIDDPIKGRKIADSHAFREALWNFWMNDLFSRLETDLDTGREGQVLITQTRWHEDDLSGRLLDQMAKLPEAIQFEVVDFPAIKETNDNPDDPRLIGDPLWPQKYDIPKLTRIKHTIGTRAWTSLYQQKPKALGGNIIKGKDFVRYTILPKILYRKIYADTAQKTAEHNDYSVFQCWGYGDDYRIYLLDQIRGKWQSPELRKRARAFWFKHMDLDWEKDRIGVLRKMMVEDKSSGTDLVQTLRVGDPRNKIKPIPIQGIERNRDKLTRLQDGLPYIEAALVCIPEDAPFTNDFVSECESFRGDMTHDFDDQVDPLLDAIQDMLSTQNKMNTWAALGEQDE